MTSSFPGTPRSQVKRVRERGTHEKEIIARILDEGLIAHVGFQTEGQPFVIPMAYARRGDSLLLHGSVGSRLIRQLADGIPACVTVTLLDGLVLARSAFHHSMNYRSVVAFGTARRILGEAEKRLALDVLVEHLVPGRTQDARRPNDAELKGTEMLEMPMEEASAKVRTGPPKDEPEDMEMDIWAGVIPLVQQAATALPDPEMPPGREAPDYVVHYRRPAGD